MSEFKRELKFFDVTQYEQEGEYLSRMHLDGWQFVSVRLPGIYKFKKCDPRKVVYQLDYNKDGLENKEEYVQMFKDCGWEYLSDFVGYSYFRKPADEGGADEGIFCDDSSRKEMMQRVFRGRMVPMVMLFAVMILLFVTQIILGYTFNYVVAALLAVVIALYAVIFWRFIKRYSGYKER